ncbi:hydantoinase B/oxoprolinase family protein [Chloroflexota bacterium]
MTHTDPITLEIFKNLFISVAEEMGVTLGRTAYSPNIKERRDFSCACFLGDGRMVAQAAHIPVHLGAMPASVRSALSEFDDWTAGDLVVLNDPYLGGTHLPDITMVSPVMIGGGDTPSFIVASRAHHADIGGMSPGSMSLATEVYQEGLIIPPVRLAHKGRTNDDVLKLILRNVRTPVERKGDLMAQIAAHRVGERRLEAILQRYGLEATLQHAESLLGYAERMTGAAISRIPDGEYTFSDEMDDNGLPGSAGDRADPGGTRPRLQVTVTVRGDAMVVDFSGTSPAVDGPINAVRAVTESATWYAVRCLAGAMTRAGVESQGASERAPVNSGTFAPVEVRVPKGCILDADPPHAVAGGNVETSQRVVDTVLGALSAAVPDLIPAASQGTMNNVTVGGHDEERGEPFTYYETVAGGAGASPHGDGLSGVQVHMTNTLNTPVEALEYAYPIRVRRYALRKGSGGLGLHRGGDGLVRDLEFLSPATVTILSERRRIAPYGLQGGHPGGTGLNLLVGAESEEALPGKVEIRVEPGDILSMRTPGGGGWGEPAGSPLPAEHTPSKP